MPLIWDEEPTGDLSRWFGDTLMAIFRRNGRYQLAFHRPDDEDWSYSSWTYATEREAQEAALRFARSWELMR